ncbi:hypothetical protein BDP55DRAFT_661199, partial [Colletotrichum godetiae]
MFNLSATLLTLAAVLSCVSAGTTRSMPGATCSQPECTVPGRGCVTECVPIGSEGSHHVDWLFNGDCGDDHKCLIKDFTCNSRAHTALMNQPCTISCSNGYKKRGRTANGSCRL